MYYVKNKEGCEIGYRSLKIAIEDFNKRKEEAEKGKKFDFLSIEEDITTYPYRADVVIWDTVDRKEYWSKKYARRETE